ncbi:protein ENTREP2 isoform X2 [Stegostoma tigrinum]|uniref:protein ENTREP2 isoform X2 n=1 Tax=Stegostoma tigrinum TaxID=3053191 RepID=UPI00202B1204|nr:protein ENTREP2 isoform X2 [Stegostoma tigrinum]
MPGGHRSRFLGSTASWGRGGRQCLLLAFGAAQMVLGGLIVAVSFAALALTSSARVRHSCPFWAGFSVLLSGLLGVVSWKRPISLVYKFDGDGVCVCCEIQEKTKGCSSFTETLKLNAVQECGTVHLALKDLLFSICALNVTSTIVCALATVTCCMQVATADIVQMLIPQRLRIPNPECVSPRGTVLQQPLDFDEFIPPIPPPPYYPPEYTCSPGVETQRNLHLDFHHSPFSTTYSVAINSPSCLYPAELPPPYEAVVGQTSTNQGSTMDHHSSESSQDYSSSLSERNIFTAFSTQVPVGNTSLTLYESADTPEHSGMSVDCCSVDVQQSVYTVDNEIPATTTDCGCTSLEADVGWQHRAYSESSCEEESNSMALSLGSIDWREHRLSEYSVVSSNTAGKTPRTPAQACTLSLKQIKIYCGVFRQSSSATMPDRVRLPPRKKTGENRIIRSSSDPVTCTSTKAHYHELHFVTSSHLAKHFWSIKQHMGKMDGHRKQQALREVSRERPHSLVDLKAYKDTKILVTKFLQHSNCNLAPEVQHVISSIQSVIWLDEQHTEEAIYSANIIDQMITSQRPMNVINLRLQEDLHLHSCGDVSSPTASVRTVQLDHRLERERPHCLTDACRETVL